MGRQIYEKNVRELMRDFAATQAGEFSKADVEAWFAEHYPLIRKATISMHLSHLSTNDPNRVRYGHYRPEDDVFVKLDTNHFRNYDAENDDAPITY